MWFCTRRLRFRRLLRFVVAAVVAVPAAAHAQATADASWMTQMAGIIGELPLNQVALPGTHDSGTYNLWINAPISPDAPEAIKTLASEPCDENYAGVNFALLIGPPVNCLLRQFTLTSSSATSR
jgi:hypothetical protein